MLVLLAYLIRRWLAVTGVIIVLLTVMLLLLALAEAASEVAAGRLPPGLFWWQLLFSLPETMNIVVPLAISAGLILSIGQLVLDREWVVMRSSGLSLPQLARAVAIVGLLAAVAMLGVTGYVQPWSHQQQQKLKEAAARSAQLWGMQPGRFVEIPGADGVAYVAAVEDEGFELHDLFIVVHKEDRNEVLTATGGRYQQTESGERYIQLEQGERIEIPDNGLQVRDARFASGVLQIPQQPDSGPDGSLSRLTLGELLIATADGERLELHWRLAAPIAVFSLALLALICAAWGRGEGRGWRVVLGILIYVAYVQAMNLAHVRIAAGLWGGMALYWIHAVFLLAALGLLALLARRF